jgi:TM2 domain-containing membrane protein YozV
MDTVRTKAADEKFCESCGEAIKLAAEICPKCGVRQQVKIDNAEPSKKSRLIATLLCLFLGWIGIHRFYVGKIGSGICMIFFSWLTAGIWPLVDFIMILAGAFRDIENKKLIKWNA